MKEASGKAYANRKKKKDRPKGDLYNTPKSLVWELLKVESFENVLEPANGKGSISEELLKARIDTIASDISTGQDFLKRKELWNGDILTNPPFDLWDDFLLKAKEICDNKICFLGRTNYFGTHKRNKLGLWSNLETVYIFDRMVDYQTPYRKDGLFHLGSLVTGWFVFNKKYTGDARIKIMDVQKYAKLGAYEWNCPVCKSKNTGDYFLCYNCSEKRPGYINDEYFDADFIHDEKDEMMKRREG